MTRNHRPSNQPPDFILAIVQQRTRRRPGSKFLGEQFDRMLLKLVDASDEYIGYPSLRFPSTPLRTRRKYDLNGVPDTT
ncbi:hypothetical protein [Bradyrhizobium canariense]|uniref:hypothetical protein n=1 Tax=Bradyrhizobium canariense TaxID=255045 RepID=UPI0011782091|nr:hypothetical protein [Bradyrhizobium canariense]